MQIRWKLCIKFRILLSSAVKYLESFLDRAIRQEKLQETQIVKEEVKAFYHANARIMYMKHITSELLYPRTILQTTRIQNEDAEVRSFPITNHTENEIRKKNLVI